MPFEVIVKSEAIDDAAAAFQYYNQVSPDLGARFLEALEKRLLHLSEHPYNYSFIDESDKKIFRDVRLPRFPYVIVYEVCTMQVIVYSVHHSRGNPAKKLKK